MRCFSLSAHVPGAVLGVALGVLLGLVAGRAGAGEPPPVAVVAGAGAAGTDAAGPARSPVASAEPEPHPATRPPAWAAWDLIALAEGERQPSSRRRITTLANFGEQRRVLALPIPDRLEFPAAIPPDAVLELGFAIQARLFSVDFLDKAGPTLFRVAFTGVDGTETVLLRRVISPRDSIYHRRWFDERIDLGRLAGKRGRLAFSVARADAPDEPGAVTALFSAARIVPAAASGDANLLFITIDCLRADHVGAYGYGRPTTPRIDGLAAEGIRFAEAYASAPMTLPSLPQIFTSAVFPEPGSPTFAHAIAAAGIPSAAIVNNVWLVLWLARNAVPFDMIASGDLTADEITDRALAWVQTHGDRRFALYLHYLDAHTPYHGPRHYARLFADPAYRGPVGDGFDDVDGANAGRFDQADHERIVSLYDGQVRFIDDQVGRLLDELRERGLLDSTIVVVSADHGEEFWDHGHFFHGQSLHDELLHVPLLARLPGGRAAGTVVKRAVRSIDIAPSLLDWLAVPRPQGFEGRRLAEAMGSPDAPPDDLIATATMGQFPTRYGIRTSAAKLVDTVDDGHRRLWDLAADPGERHDVLAERPKEAAELGGRLADARRAMDRDGVQLHVVGPHQGKAHFSLALRSLADTGVFETLDRTGGPVDDTRITLSSDGRDLYVRGTTDARGRDFRFDRRLLLLAAAGGKPDRLRARLRVDGTRAAPGSVRLGDDRALSDDGLLSFAEPAMRVAQVPACPAPESGVRACLWRSAEVRAEPVPVPLPVADDAARDRLRALGYIQ
jgi:arylsulfatase A-like enzyme